MFLLATSSDHLKEVGLFQRHWSPVSVTSGSRKIPKTITKHNKIGLFTATEFSIAGNHLKVKKWITSYFISCHGTRTAH